MPAYEEVAKMPISKLIQDNDSVQLLDPAASLQEAATHLKRKPAIVIVTAEGRLAMLTESDVTEAVSEGRSLDTHVSELVDSSHLMAISAEAPLEAIAGLPSSISTLVITNEDGKPTGVIRREDLGDRVKRFA